MNFENIEVQKLNITDFETNKSQITAKTNYDYGDFISNLVFLTPELEMPYYSINNYYHYQSQNSNKYGWQIPVDNNNFINFCKNIDNIIFDCLNEYQKEKSNKDNYYGIIRKKLNHYIDLDYDEEQKQPNKYYIKTNLYLSEDKNIKHKIFVNGVQMNDVSLDYLSNLTGKGSKITCKLAVSKIWMNKQKDYKGNYNTGVKLFLKELRIKMSYTFMEAYENEYMFSDNPYQKIEHIPFSQIDINQINVSNGQTNPNGLHMRFINYNDEPRFCFETSDIFMNNYGLIPKKFGDQYYVKVPVYGCTSAFLKVLTDVDEFFKKSVPDHKYTQIIKNSYNPDYPPYMKLKLATINNNDDEEITTAVFVNETKIPVKTLDDLREFLKYKSTIRLVCQVSSMWIEKNNKRFGVTLKILQLKIIKEVKKLVDNEPISEILI